MRVLYISFLSLVAVIVVLFAVSNSQQISLNYYFGQENLPLSLALGMSFTIGIFLGIFVCLKTIISTKYKIRLLKHDMKLANKEISNLRAIPIKDSH